MGNAFKQKEGRFSLDKRKKYITTRVGKHRNRLHRGVVEAPFLEIFKVRLNQVLSNPIDLKTSLLIAGELD